MLHLKPFSVEDKAIFEQYTHLSGKQNCDLSFTNCYIWNPHARWCIENGSLIVRFNIVGGEKIAYCEPLGTGDVDAVLDLMKQDEHSHGQPLRLFNMSEEFARKIKNSSYAQTLHMYTNRANYDYIYDAQRLRTLSGKELQPKRNHVNQFKRLYNYHVEALTPTHLSQVMNLLDRWVEEKEQSPSSQVSFTEIENIRRSFEHFEQLGLTGIALYVDGRMIAFTYGSPINDTTFDIHIEKADTAYIGVFAMINQQFLQHLPSHYLYINREEDMGIHGLRQSKMSYHPDILYSKWYACEENTIERAIWLLWQEVFHDDDAFISTYINNYSTEENMLFTQKEGQVVSMVHLPQFYNKYGKVGYIYAVATLPDERGKGYASALIKEAFERMYHRGDIVSILIPSDDKIALWYSEKFCFSQGKDEDLLHFHTEVPFDFGTGIEQRDKGMYRVVCVEKYMAQYAKQHPDEHFIINVCDTVISENNGKYEVKNGFVLFSKDDETPNEKISPREVFEKYILKDNHLFIQYIQ